MFIAGIGVGVVVATGGYALVERAENSQTTTGTTLVLKLAHCLDTGHPVHIAMEYMGERLAEKSGGTLQIQIAPNGQLGTETESIELMQHGALALAKTSAAPLESFVPEVALFGIPYVFRDEAHFWQVADGPIGDELLAAGESVGLRGLCWYDAGARSFYTKKTPILEPSDLDGLKIRVQNSQTALKLVETLGGSPTPMNFGELYTSLQQGLVDGAENNPPSFHFSRHFEVCKEYSLDEHSRVPDVLLMSAQWWDRLTPQQQQWVQEAADESSVMQRKLWRERTAESIAAVQAEGVTVHRPDTSKFAERVSQLQASYAGTPAGKLIQRIQQSDSEANASAASNN